MDELARTLSCNPEYSTGTRGIRTGRRLLSLLPKRPIKFLGIKVNELLLPIREDHLRKILTDNNLPLREKYLVKVRWSGGSEYLTFHNYGYGKLVQPLITGFDGFFG